jgi:ADP-ribosylglycohydrolase
MAKSSMTFRVLPEALYLAVRHEECPEQALIANAMLGGDSAARAVVVGGLVGAARLEAGLPDRWLEGLHARDAAVALLATLEADAC